MRFYIEFFGYPGSGKTYLTNNLSKKLKNRNIKILKNDKYFFDYFSSGVLKKMIYKNYYLYKTKKKFNSKYLFRYQYNNLNNQLSRLIKANKLEKIVKKYKSIINLTTLNSDGKKRSMDNFKIDLCSYYINSNNSKIYLINDEGIIQNLYQPYKNNINNSFLKKKIISYLNSIPIPNLIIFIDKNFKKAYLNAKKRNNGFCYEKKNLNNTELQFSIISKTIKEIMNKKTKMILVKKNDELYNKFLRANNL